MKYQPHREVSPTGEAVVVLRLPKEATILERIESHKEAQRLSRATKMVLKREYWRNKARDEYRQKQLREIVD
jgi:hypothetical protein